MNQRAACIPARRKVFFSARKSATRHKRRGMDQGGHERRAGARRSCFSVRASSRSAAVVSLSPGSRSSKCSRLKSVHVYSCRTSLWSFFCQTLCPFYLRRGVGSNLSKTTVFRPDACASEETSVSLDSESVLFSDAFFQIALRLLKS